MKEMKKFLLMLLVVALPMTVVTACSDDDDKSNPEKTLSEEVQGTYTGTSTATVNGTSQASASVSVEIAKVLYKDRQVTATFNLSVTAPTSGTTRAFTLDKIGALHIKGKSGDIAFGEMDDDGTSVSDDATGDTVLEFTEVSTVENPGKQRVAVKAKFTGTIKDNRTLSFTATKFELGTYNAARLSAADVAYLTDLAEIFQTLSVTVSAQQGASTEE